MSAHEAPVAGPSGPRPDERPGTPGQADRAAAPGGPRRRPKPPAVPEIGGPQGPEPTRYGDWEKGGRCTDF
jgi:hypothetical protein